MAGVGVPKPKPWREGVAKTVGTDGVEALTATRAWEIYSGAIGYHLPRQLNDAMRLLEAARMTA
jgi:hypothetical protein